MKISDLSNEEVIFIFSLIGDMKLAYDEIIRDKGISHSIVTDAGKIKIFQSMEDEHIEEMKKSDKVVLISSISDKLKPVAELIIETNPKLADRIQNCLLFNSDEED